MNAERQRPQPDFPLAAESLRSVAEQLERCGNLPAVDGGAHLVDRMDRMEALLREIRGMLHGMSRRMDASDANAVVRIENSAARSRDARLVPLLSSTNGEPAVGCPATVAEALAFQTRDANRLLTDLGLSTQGGLEEKRKRILFAMGVRGIDF
ncbi:hypothetical protein HIM_12119 [Hirsutella minnesotensis 3608]|uniref:Uncharacterized protein n=1 Tax=Hirsutella minnesotensis 3608 TaxID=1043627 RepID=A0A0F8A0F2_9HYPO|nr:hypothetical protein HIM_12119 [Hirsutella minnesotensis 3608]